MSTIAAMITAPGEAGVSILRLSGPDALRIAEGIFVPKGKRRLAEHPRMLLFGNIADQDAIVDEVLVSYMKAPHSYTAEDVIEINCHGGYQSASRILELTLRRGARLAEAGEFTKRAFLNGRIDLSQAEAVMDIITAKTGAGHAISQKQLAGKLSNVLTELRDRITEAIARITVAVDFPDEDEPEVTYPELIAVLDDTAERLQKLLASFEIGRMYTDGLRTVIVGKPNVGKSSLLNRLLSEDRAIVTEVAGTTRDVIEEYFHLGGIPIRLVDTAGIRDTEDIVEKIGVDRSIAAIESADLILFVLDGSRALGQEDFDIMDKIRHRSVITLINKSDLQQQIDLEELRDRLGNNRNIFCSMKNNSGLEPLQEEILAMVSGGAVRLDNEYMINNARHKDALERAAHACSEAKRALEELLPLDIIETDFRTMWDTIGEITGDTASEDLLNVIFSKFCIGK